MASPTSPALDRSRLLALGWAVFLGCSWTWCIGMYLPVLMVRDFGLAGWVVFMAPNVIGAAAMGWVLHRPGAAANFSRGHWPAVAAFSIVTILFHAFFVGWIARGLVGPFAGVITAAAALGFYFFGKWGRRDLLAAGIVFAVSILALMMMLAQPGNHPTGPIAVQPMVGLLWLSPVCVFGFFLCPYLDLTFLRARASTDSPTGIAAFTIGFGLFFLVMLLFTLAYARVIQPARLNQVPAVLAWIIAVHLMLQTAYTVALHCRGLAQDRRAKSPAAAGSFFAAILLAYLIGAWGDGIVPGRHGLSSGEVVYRLFMGFYGLVFPAYVWLCMIPPPGGRVVSRIQKWRILAAAVAIALPMFWLGFIENRMIWLVPGAAVLLLSRLALYRADKIAK